MNIDFCECLSFLEFCDISEINQSNGPSWVSNWLRCSEHEREPINHDFGISGCGLARQVGPGTLEVHGVECGIVKDVTVPAPFEGDLRPVIQQWEPSSIRHASYITGESLMDSFLATLCCGAPRESWPNYDLPSLNEYKEVYDYYLSFQSHAAPGSLEKMFLDLFSYIKGRSFFQSERHIGLCLPAANQVSSRLAKGK